MTLNNTQHCFVCSIRRITEKVPYRRFPWAGPRRRGVGVAARPLMHRPLAQDSDQLERHRFVPADVGTDLVSCGTPRDHDVLIADLLTGEALEPGAIGEIWVRGSSVSKGYWRNTPANEQAFAPGGYVRTGDLGTLHGGELYVTGRLAEMMIVRGRNLYPHDLERTVRIRARYAGDKVSSVSERSVETAVQRG